MSNGINQVGNGTPGRSRHVCDQFRSLKLCKLAIDNRLAMANARERVDMVSLKAMIFYPYKKKESRINGSRDERH